MYIKSNKFYGKKLPVIFATGYFRSIESIVGRGHTIIYYQGAAQSLIENKEAREKWLAPLQMYFSQDYHYHQPLDYIYISLFQLGITNNLFPNENAVIKFTKHIGEQWWYGYTPAYPTIDKTSLSLLFVSNILKYLNELKVGKSNQVDHSVFSSKQLIILGLERFLILFEQKSGIHFELHQMIDTLKFTLKNVPFVFSNH